MSTYSPTYRAIAAQFTPMTERDGKRLLSNPALQGSSEPQALLANILVLGGQYYFTGPGLAMDQLQPTVVAGAAAVARFNQGRPESRRIHCTGTHEAALTGVWQLVSTHYGIANAAEQVVDEQLRRATENHREVEEGLARQERAGAAFERMRAATAAFLASYQTERRPAAIQESAAAEQEFMATMPGTAVWVRADEEAEGLVPALVSEAYDRGDIRTAHGVNNWGHFCPLSYSQEQARAFFTGAEQTLEYACTLD